MSFFVRKISIAKWKIDSLENSDAAADAITTCLRTSSDTLSLWKIEEEEDYFDAVLAIIASQEKFEKIDIIIINESEFQESLEIIQTSGKTPVERLVNTHYDLINLTYSKLGIIMDIYLKNLRSEKTKRITRLDSINIVKEAISRNLLDPNKLNEKLRMELEKQNAA